MRLEIDILRPHFAALGFEIIHFGESKNANGPDMWVRKTGGRPMSVEVKKVTKKPNGQVATDPVGTPRRNDDLIAIICTPQYVLIEPMRDHLKACGPKGHRALTTLLGRNP